MIESVKIMKEIPVLKRIFQCRNEILGVDTDDQIVLIGMMQQPEILVVKPRRGRPKGIKKPVAGKHQVVNGDDTAEARVSA